MFNKASASRRLFTVDLSHRQARGRVVHRARSIIRPRVLPDQAQHHRTDGTHSRRPIRPLGPGVGSVPYSDQVTMPAQHGIRANQQSHPTQRLRSQPVQQRRQQRSASRSEPHLPFAQLAFRHCDLVA